MKVRVVKKINAGKMNYGTGRQVRNTMNNSSSKHLSLMRVLTHALLKISL